MPLRTTSRDALPERRRVLIVERVDLPHFLLITRESCANIPSKLVSTFINL